MEQPPGYIALGESNVCKLKKAIYGLKQSPRAWFDKFSQIYLVLVFSGVIQIILCLFFAPLRGQ